MANDVTGRKNYGLVEKLSVAGVLMLACINSGGLYAGGGTGRVGPFSARMMPNNAMVFAAAPVKRIRIPFLKIECASLKSPPPYVRAALSNVHPSQLIPSRGWTKLPPISTFLSCGPSDTLALGIAPGTPTAGTCAQVDVWIPKEMMDAQQAPTIKDPNASITLDMVPSKGGDCEIWHYHYLKPGEKPPSRTGRSSGHA